MKAQRDKRGQEVFMCVHKKGIIRQYVLVRGHRSFCPAKPPVCLQHRPSLRSVIALESHRRFRLCFFFCAALLLGQLTLNQSWISWSNKITRWISVSLRVETQTGREHFVLNYDILLPENYHRYRTTQRVFILYVTVYCYYCKAKDWTANKSLDRSRLSTF